MNSSGEAAARVLKLAARGELGFEVRVEIEDADADPRSTGVVASSYSFIYAG